MHPVNRLMQQGDRAVILRQSLALILGLALLAGLPGKVHALGFGTLTLASHLNEKLNAEVPLILSASDDIDTVHVELASQRDYGQVGLPWQPELSRIKVFIQARHSSQPLVVLRSVGVIGSTMLSVLLKAQKSGRGTYYKHFQLLFDPVEINTLRQQQPTVTALQAEPDEPVSTPVSPLHEQGWSRVWRYGPVHAGDSLSEIAYRLRRDKRFSNRQVMLSLYKKNPHGFVDGDINQLKQGAWLTVPRGDVVKQYAGKAAMHTLTLLLTHHHADSRATGQPVVKPVKADKNITQQAAELQRGQELRYSGKIAINGASASTDALKSLQSNVNKRFDAMHTEMMAGRLQMADLGKSVASLDQSVQGIQQDIHALRKDVAMIKNRSERVAPADILENWQVALLALLAGLLGAWIAIISQKKVAAVPAANAVGKQPATSVKSIGDNSKPADDDKLLASEAVQALNQAEESLSKCEYEKAERLLTKIDSLSPDSLRGMALKAQLYHETDRQDARNDLINSISGSSDKQRWERFCNLLPSHVWNACFGGDATEMAGHESRDT